jgi:hypothetical protein
MSQPSFGVLVDDEALAMGALDNVFVDGAVAVPIRLGLGLSTIQRATDLVALGLVSVDVTGADGAGLPTHHLEIAPANQATPGLGQSAWLIWVGQRAFEPNTAYRLEYAFVNDKISMCPESLPITGELSFSTGAASAKGQLETVTTFTFSQAVIYPQLRTEFGCCSAPESMPCVNEGNCVACWASVYSVGQASAVANVPLPVSYFAVDVSLLAGEVEQVGTNQGAEGYTTFLVKDSAPEYCFEARLHPRALLDEALAISSCLPSIDVLKANVTLPFTPLPIADCVEPPSGQAGEHDVAQARFAKTEQEAQSAILGIMTPPSPGPVTATPTPDDHDGCTVLPRGGEPSGAPWLVGLLLLARRRR